MSIKKVCFLPVVLLAASLASLAADKAKTAAPAPAATDPYAEVQPATETLDLKGADVAYVCRIQKERFSDPYQAVKLQSSFRIMPELLKEAEKDMILMHPLPKVDEIPPEVDASPHAYYFQQAACGVPVRMAVLEHVFKGE